MACTLHFILSCLISLSLCPFPSFPCLCYLTWLCIRSARFKAEIQAAYHNNGLFLGYAHYWLVLGSAPCVTQQLMVKFYHLQLHHLEHAGWSLQQKKSLERCRYYFHCFSQQVTYFSSPFCCFIDCIWLHSPMQRQRSQEK